MSQPVDRLILEVCVASIDDAVAAAGAGASRLELNLALELDGLTPSLALLVEAKQVVEIPIIAMVRPRAGDFHYGVREKTVMLRDAELLLAHGADGIACGALDAQLAIDEPFWRQLARLVGSRELVFHRALDAIPNPVAALERLIDLGTTRVLTSGGAKTAIDGAQQLARLVAQTRGRIDILPAAGVSAEHVAELVATTGCRQIHGSFRDPHTNPPRTSSQRVAAARAALNAWQSQQHG
jgi:copper homeostasis protein